MHLANLSSKWLATIITEYNTISVNSTAFYLHFGRETNGNRSQSKDKVLWILLRFVLYPAMMVANH